MFIGNLITHFLFLFYFSHKKILNDVFVKFLDWLFPFRKLISFDVIIETMKSILFIRNIFKLNFVAIYETCDGPVGWDLSHCVFVSWSTSCFLVSVGKNMF